jgi:hypothetical protein
MYMKLKQLSAGIAMMFLPLAALAQTPTVPKATNIFAQCSAKINTLTDILYWFTGCVVGKSTVMLIIAVTVIVFMIGALRYIAQAGAGNAEYATKLRDYLVWSIITLFVMLSVWGLVYFIGATLGIGQGGNAPIPQFQITK